MSVEKQLVLRLLRYAIGLKKLAPLFHPIRSKTKTNRDSLVRVFLTLRQLHVIRVLIGSLDYVSFVIG